MFKLQWRLDYLHFNNLIGFKNGTVFFALMSKLFVFSYSYLYNVNFIVIFLNKIIDIHAFIHKFYFFCEY